MNAIVVCKVPSSMDSLFNQRCSKHVIDSSMIAIWIGFRRIIVRPDGMQIVELTFSECTINAYLILAVGFIGIQREDNFMVVLLECLSELDDVTDELGPDVWLCNSRRKKERILLIIETESALQLLTGAVVGC